MKRIILILFLAGIVFLSGCPEEKINCGSDRGCIYNAYLDCKMATFSESLSGEGDWRSQVGWRPVDGEWSYTKKIEIIGKATIPESITPEGIEGCKIWYSQVEEWEGETHKFEAYCYGLNKRNDGSLNGVDCEP